MSIEFTNNHTTIDMKPSVDTIDLHFEGARGLKLGSVSELTGTSTKCTVHLNGGDVHHYRSAQAVEFTDGATVTITGPSVSGVVFAEDVRGLRAEWKLVG